MKKPDYKNFIALDLWSVTDAAQILAGTFPPKTKLTDEEMNLGTGGKVALLYMEFKNRTRGPDGVVNPYARIEAREAIRIAKEHLGIDGPEDLVAGVHARTPPIDWRARAEQAEAKLVELNTWIQEGRPAPQPQAPPALLRMVLGMAIAAYGYTPGAPKNQANGDIRDVLAGIADRKLSVDISSIRDWLEKAAAANPPKPRGLGAELHRHQAAKKR